MHESCGVFGVYAPGEDVARLTFFALFALQHRGQESAGIATTDGKRLQVYARMGLVSHVFSEDSLSQLTGDIAIGHNRYSTRGSSRASNAQPLIVGKGLNAIAVAHNGNIVNAEHLYQELSDQGYTFHTSTDTEVIANLILSSTEKRRPASVGSKACGRGKWQHISPGSLFTDRACGKQPVDYGQRD